MRLRSNRQFGWRKTQQKGLVVFQLADNVPGQPHRWAAEIAAWAHGQLVQWRYVSQEATDADWRDCDYPSRGVPNFWERHTPSIEFRVAPTPWPPVVRCETCGLTWRGMHACAALVRPEAAR